ncbi:MULTISPECIES: ABC transporter substrate-binding protein [unclassified Leifsonia]|uniref:ABC transporter substrate-binding protein n=1 Tax=unclassified Leifsonia TaxID=2663824 RepID=UPI000A1915E7|nr:MULTISPECIES: ABC transporter substrate-binding protein [unclassified Leifsonia]QIZ97317.1 carbohydrate ABC transporter substrate-binding protein [Leifsonia sp. PS1209]
MFSRRTAARVAATVASTAVLAATLVACSSSGGGGSSITLMAGGNDPAATKFAKSIADGFMKENPSIKVKVNTRPGGTDGDNLIKTRLSTRTMDDVFLYNSGSLFQALNPDTQLQPLTDEAWVKELTPDFKKTVSTSKATYGAPWGTTFNGGIMYNKKVYEKLGLTVPKTWAEFISNSEKIKAAGIIPVLQSYGDTWTSQLFVLADFANISKQDPEWATKYTENKAKYVDPPALAGFTHTQEVFDKGLMNKDYASLTNVNALKLLATGEAAQYPMITAVISNVVQSNPDQVNDIGYFAMPADSGEGQATVWEANGAYIPKSTTGDKLTAAKKLVAFINSPKGCDVQNSAGVPAGPFAISSCKLPDDAPALVADELKYQEAKQTGLALEFLSPIKGPNLEKILIQVGSGITDAKAGAALYDNDVKAQAQQLGLKGW